MTNIKAYQSESRAWWAVVCGNHVVESIGYKTNKPEIWWFPELNLELSEGFSIFSERKKALSMAIEYTKDEIRALEYRLVILKTELTKASSERPKASSECSDQLCQWTTKASSEYPKASSERPKASSERPKASSECSDQLCQWTTKASSEYPKASSEYLDQLCQWTK